MRKEGRPLLKDIMLWLRACFLLHDDVVRCREKCHQWAGGVYCSYKDTADLGDLREVLLAGFEPAEAPKQREEFVFEAWQGILLRRGSKYDQRLQEIAKKAASDVANPEGSLAKFISLQKALRAGFAEDSFQDTVSW